MHLKETTEGTFRTYSQGLTAFHDASGSCCTGIVELVLQGLARKYSGPHLGKVALGGFKTVRQVPMGEFIKGTDPAFTAQCHIVLLKDFSWRHGENGS